MLNKLLLTENCYSCLLNLFVYVSCYYSNANVLKFVNKLSMLDIKEEKEKNLFSKFELLWNVMLSMTEHHDDVHWSLFEGSHFKKHFLQFSWSKTWNSRWFLLIYFQFSQTSSNDQTLQFSDSPPHTHITTHSLSLFDRKQRCLSQPRIILLPV